MVIMRIIPTIIATRFNLLRLITKFIFPCEGDINSEVIKRITAIIASNSVISRKDNGKFIIIPLIALADWGTQRLLLRKSSTESRLITGFLLGVAWRLVLYTERYYLLMMIIISIYFGVLFFLIYLGNRKMIKQVRGDLNQLSEVEDD